MTGLDALGYMLLEEGRITAVRNETLGARIDLEPILEGKAGINLPPDHLIHDSWEIGWTCGKCLGSGEITVPCPRCSGRSLHSLLENPCCDGTNEQPCPDCDSGIRWESAY